MCAANEEEGDLGIGGHSGCKLRLAKAEAGPVSMSGRYVGTQLPDRHPLSPLRGGVPAQPALLEDILLIFAQDRAADMPGRDFPLGRGF
ncbi:hypothetical protein CLG96_10015 [Sphingomonas oleivorans]|uniref:Uncharacterized protein n=1 Tax=Sphingomonas oleivorans TaxID=1735121 RepID=A0A2T5FX80_9SPHN|nr:hypothetical protein CLG96_10015 [Sphingomonas oleivorans]